MDCLFVSISEINAHQIIEKVNEKIVLGKSAYIYDGLEFKIIYADDEFVQILVYAYNLYTTRILGACVHNSGFRLGAKLDTPILIESDGGFAGVLCSYVLIISKRPIARGQVYPLIGVDDSWSRKPFYSSQVLSGVYEQLSDRFFISQKITSFAEMMHYIDIDKPLRDITHQMVQHTVLYKENFVSAKEPNRSGHISFQENLTLAAAKPSAVAGKRTAILNFANPVEPGGGTKRGAEAQEEYICRSTNLYKALTSEAAKKYYELNNSILKKNQFNSMFIGTDMALYSPGVTVLKDAVGYRPHFSSTFVEEYRNTTYSVDVITCAAPFFSSTKYILPNGDLEYLLKKRIRNIFEIAMENDISAIILGAFGCGAFHNPPDVVASTFRDVLLEERYRKAFDEVVFAVKRSDTVCPNIEAFESHFSQFPAFNDNSTEKSHRLLWKWVCTCGFENAWDDIHCKRCMNSKKKFADSHHVWSL